MPQALQDFAEFLVLLTKGFYLFFGGTASVLDVCLQILVFFVELVELLCQFLVELAELLYLFAFFLGDFFQLPTFTVSILQEHFGSNEVVRFFAFGINYPSFHSINGEASFGIPPSPVDDVRREYASFCLYNVFHSFYRSVL